MAGGTRYSISDIDFVVSALSKGATMTAAIRGAGLSVMGFYEHMDKHPDVKLRCQTAKAKIRQVVELSLFKAATEPDPVRGWGPANVKAQQIYLYNTAPDDWREVMDARSMDLKDEALARRAADLSPEELAKLRAEAPDAIFAPVSDAAQ